MKNKSKKLLDNMMISEVVLYIDQCKTNVKDYDHFIKTIRYWIANANTKINHCNEAIRDLSKLRKKVELIPKEDLMYHYIKYNTIGFKAPVDITSINYNNINVCDFIKQYAVCNKSKIYEDLLHAIDMNLMIVRLNKRDYLNNIKMYQHRIDHANCAITNSRRQIMYLHRHLNVLNK